MDRHSWQNSRIIVAKAPRSKKVDRGFRSRDSIINKISKPAENLLCWVLNKGLAYRVSDRYQNANAMFEDIDELAEFEHCAPYKLFGNLPQVRDIFEGRSSLIEQIHNILGKESNCLFLEGIGGIGKSELAKQYAKRFSEDYDNVLFLSYTQSIKLLFCDDNAVYIENFSRYQDESDDEYFNRKMKIFRAVTDERTLVIIDNFDVDDDPDLSVLTSGFYHTIFTTRNSHPGYTSVKVNAIDDIEVLNKIFIGHYEDEINESDYPVLKEIFELIEYHTYTIELIAKQMQASFLTVGDMLSLLKNGSLKNSISEKIEGRSKYDTVFGHMCVLFNTGKLSEEEQGIMRYMSLIGISGIPAQRFRERAMLDSFDSVNSLIRKSWIRRGSGQRLSLHPLVCEVVRTVLKPDFDNCREFLANVSKFCSVSWFRKYKENIPVNSCITEILSYFKDIPSDGILYLEPLVGFLWQVGRFEDSIKCGHILYERAFEFLGEASTVTGYIALCLGDAYFNSRREEKSIPWYKKGLQCMLLAGGKPTEDLALAYEKVGRCYTLKYARNYDIAKEYFEKAISIRNQIIEAEDLTSYKTVAPFVAPRSIKLVILGISNIYLEMGRMYQKMGDFQKAIECAQTNYDIIRKYKPDNLSNMAYSLFDQGVSFYKLAVSGTVSGREKREYLIKAKDLLSQALEINMTMRGGLAADTIDNQEAFADVLAALKNYEGSAKAYRTTIDMIQNLFGSHNPRIQAVKEKMKALQYC